MTITVSERVAVKQDISLESLRIYSSACVFLRSYLMHDILMSTESEHGLKSDVVFKALDAEVNHFLKEYMNHRGCALETVDTYAAMVELSNDMQKVLDEYLQEKDMEVEQSEEIAALRLDENFEIRDALDFIAYDAIHEVLHHEMSEEKTQMVFAMVEVLNYVEAKCELADPQLPKEVHQGIEDAVQSEMKQNPNDLTDATPLLTDLVEEYMRGDDPVGVEIEPGLEHKVYDDFIEFRELMDNDDGAHLVPLELYRDLCDEYPRNQAQIERLQARHESSFDY